MITPPHLNFQSLKWRLEGLCGVGGRGVKVFSGATVYTILKQLELVTSEMSTKWLYFFTDNWILFAKLIYFLGLLKSKAKLTNNQTCKEDLTTQLYMSRAFSAERGLPWWFSQGHPTISKILKVLPFVLPFDTLTPNIKEQILLSGPHTFHIKVLKRSYVRILISRKFTFGDHILNSHELRGWKVLILQGEIWCWSLVGLKGSKA